MLLNFFQGLEEFWIRGNLTVDDLVAVNRRLSSVSFHECMGNAVRVHDLRLQLTRRFLCRDSTHYHREIDIFKVDDVTVLHDLATGHLGLFEEAFKVSANGTLQSPLIHFVENLLRETSANEPEDDAKQLEAALSGRPAIYVQRGHLREVLGRVLPFA